MNDYLETNYSLLNQLKEREKKIKDQYTQNDPEENEATYQYLEEEKKDALHIIQQNQELVKAIQKEQDMLLEIKEYQEENERIADYIQQLKDEKRMNRLVQTKKQGFLKIFKMENATYQLYYHYHRTGKIINIYWAFSTNEQTLTGELIKNGTTSRKNEQEAEQHKSAIIDYFREYFREDKPDILKEWEIEKNGRKKKEKGKYHIDFRGIRLEGYKVEGEE